MASLYNKYKAVFEDDSAKSIVAKNISEATSKLSAKYEDDNNALLMVKLEEKNILAATDAIDTLTFTTAVNDSNGGKIYPEDNTVSEGDSKIFTAVPSSGYVFNYYTIDDAEDQIKDNPYTVKNIKKSFKITAYFTSETPEPSTND